MCDMGGNCGASSCVHSSLAQESTIDVKLVRSGSRTLQPLASASSSSAASGSSPTEAAAAVLYDYEYELDSTRGLKRIVNTVTIYGGQLYILNAMFKCDNVSGSLARGAC